MYYSLTQQRSMLAADGLLARNLRAVQRVQIQLGLIQPGSPLPVVDDGPLRAALP